MQLNARSDNANADLGYHLLCIAEQRFGCSPQRMDAAQRHEAERIARRQLEIEAAVLASSEARSVLVPPSEVQTALANIRARYGDALEFERELQANDLDEALLRSALARELRVDAVLARVAASAAEVDETEARLYYYLHPQQFQQPEMRIARHILITINPDYPENRREAALRRQTEIARRVARKPDRFAEQAQKHSECPTAMEGGLLGRVKRGVLYPELEAALFNLREGAVSDVIESELGFHVLLCEKIYVAGLASISEVLPKLRAELNARERQRHQRRWLDQLLASPQALASR